MREVLTRTIIIMVMAATWVAAAAPSVQWTRTFSVGQGPAQGNWVTPVIGGGYVVAGWVYPDTISNRRCGYVLKTDSLGNREWDSVFGTAADDVVSDLWAVLQTSDGGLVLLGTIEDTVLRPQPFLAKLDTYGHLQWQHILNFHQLPSELGRAICETPDKSLVLSTWVGGPQSAYGVHIIKTDSSGVLQWERGVDLDARFNPLLVPLGLSADGGYVTAGMTDDAAQMVGLDSLGVQRWQRTYSENEPASVFSLTLCADRGFALTGGGRDQSNSDDPGAMVLVKTDSIGNVQWIKSYGGAEVDCGVHVEQTNDLGYIVAGSTTDQAGEMDAYLVRTNSAGIPLWERTLGVPNCTDVAWCVRQTEDGGYVATGGGMASPDLSRRTSIFLVKIAADSNR